MRRLWVILVLIGAALVLTGCGAPREEEAVAADTPAPTAAPSRAQGPMDRAVDSVLSPFEREVSQVTPQLDDAMAVTLPGDMLRQMAEDAWQSGAAAVDGRYHFTWRQSGEHTYVAVNEDTRPEDWSTTPDPDVEAPMGDAEMDAAEVSGGGMFHRLRVYDAAEDLSFGTAEITDTLNGEPSGYEFFSFALRDGCLYYVDAVRDLTVNLDTLEFQQNYAVTAGVLRRDGLDVISFTLADLTELPDPATMDWNALVSSVTPVSRITARNGQVQTGP